MSDLVTPWTAKARPPCPSPTPGACSNSCPSSWWCCPSISSSVSSAFPPAFSISQHQDLFLWANSSHQVAKVLEFQLQHQSFQWIFRIDFLQDWWVWNPWSPWHSEESSPTPQFKIINSAGCPPPPRRVGRWAEPRAGGRTDRLTGGTGGEQDGADSGHQEESLLLLRRGCWKLLLWTRPPNEASPNPHDSQFTP